MSIRVTSVIYILLVALGSVLISACPVDREKSEIWLVNTTVEKNYTTFVYRTADGGSLDDEMVLPVSIAPGEAYKLELDRSLVESMTTAGMKGPNGAVNMNTVPGFGSGNADLLVDRQVNGVFPSTLAKSLS